MWTDTKVASLLNISQGYKGHKTHENACAASCPQCRGKVDESNVAHIKGRAKKTKQNPVSCIYTSSKVEFSENYYPGRCFLKVLQTA